MAEITRPKVAVHKFSSCDGCQLQMLCLEDELLALTQRIDIAYFLEATSKTVEGPYDISFVEGSVTTAEEAKRIKEIRQESTYLVSIGACAVAGGIQTLKNWADVEEFTRVVYASPEYIHSLKTATPISEHVPVDFELNGCPINKYQLLELVASLLAGRMPHFPGHTVCVDCKRNGTVCVAVTQDVPCLGPLTHAGCGGLCPSFNRGCYGCFGPSEKSKAETYVEFLRKKRRYSNAELIRKLRGFTGYSHVFRATSEELERSSS